MIGKLTTKGFKCNQHLTAQEREERFDWVDDPTLANWFERQQAELVYDLSWWRELSVVEDHDALMDLSVACWCETCGVRIDGMRTEDARSG
jgi:hypothetical protein